MGREKPFRNQGTCRLRSAERTREKPDIIVTGSQDRRKRNAKQNFYRRRCSCARGSPAMADDSLIVQQGLKPDSNGRTRKPGQPGCPIRPLINRLRVRLQMSLRQIRHAERSRTFNESSIIQQGDWEHRQLSPSTIMGGQAGLGETRSGALIQTNNNAVGEADS